MSFTQPSVLVIGVVITGVMFAIVAFFTRAPWKRIISAILASVPVVPLVMLYDAIATRFGWWSYPSLTTPHAPIAWYIAAALWYGAGLGLIGWRLIRRHRKKGLAAFLLVVGLFGLFRDLFYSSVTGLIQFGPGVLPLALDFLAYVSAAALVQFLMRIIAGPPSTNQLSRKADH